ncbi:hypothetical protein Glove_360g87 [Diversispora epigaea]|uniref:Uncharacterized protein n=1 Tax=Diversispora epigaea TaxID=1348612 RepID=A0A397HF27_9GLOM|nr:hypothetical protein Glove_360g87 [Diversispora epigaea]
MPAKLTTIRYIHDRITSEYTIKEITGIIRLDNNDSQKLMYLRIKSFIPLDLTVKTQMKEFEKEQIVKFMANSRWCSIRIMAFLLFCYCLPIV